MSSAYQRAVRGQRSNLPVLIGLGIMVAGFASIPMMLRKTGDNKNLLLQDKALTGSQIQRGAYLNSGSKDAGPDPVRVASSYILQQACHGVACAGLGHEEPHIQRAVSVKF